MDLSPAALGDLRCSAFVIRRCLPIGLACALALIVAACGSPDSGRGGPSTSPHGKALPGKGRPPVIMGTKNFTEQFILGELYSQALRDKGFMVRVKRNIGSSEIIQPALVSGAIDLYAEYTGVIAVELALVRPRPRSAEETYRVASAWEAKRGITTLRSTPFSDAIALAVKPAFARRHGLVEVGDLKRLKSFTFGGAPENRTRYQGLIGMRQAYGLNNVKFTIVPFGEQYRALDSGRFDVVNVLTTDGELERGQYVLLKDPKRIFGFQHAAPVVNNIVLDRQGPAFARTLNAVSATLTQAAMRSMNGAVDIDRRPPQQVAAAFLRREGLVSG
jgi:osmoprotectant transport system substrate-binding protein